MFSVPKLLLLGALLWAVWLAFRLIDRRNKARDDNADTDDAHTPVETIECDRCGAFVAASGCDKADCPLDG